MIAAMIDTEELEVLKYYVATAENSDSRQDPLGLAKVEDEEFGVYMMGTNDGEWGENSDPDPTGDTKEGCPRGGEGGGGGGLGRGRLKEKWRLQRRSLA